MVGAYDFETVSRAVNYLYMHFISPKPADVPSMMEGLLEFCRGSGQIDPVVAAAVGVSERLDAESSESNRLEQSWTANRTSRWSRW